MLPKCRLGAFWCRLPHRFLPKSAASGDQSLPFPGHVRRQQRLGVGPQSGGGATAGDAQSMASAVPRMTGGRDNQKATGELSDVGWFVGLSVRAGRCGYGKKRAPGKSLFGKRKREGKLGFLVVFYFNFVDPYSNIM